MPVAFLEYIEFQLLDQTFRAVLIFKNVSSVPVLMTRAKVTGARCFSPPPPVPLLFSLVFSVVKTR